MILFYYIRKFFRISKIERSMLIQGLILCSLFYIVVRVLPLRFYNKLIIDSTLLKTSYKCSAIQIKYVRKTLKRIEKCLWFDLSCLVKSLTIKFLLNNLGIESRIELGINKSGSSLNAHAYVIADNKYVLLNKNGFTKVLTV